jgi:hypothetical protein
MEWLQFASPTIIGQLALTDIAGTSGHRFRWFAEQATGFQKEWQAHFPAEVLAGATPLTQPLPAFRYNEEPLQTVARRTLVPITLLAFAGTGLVWTGLRRFEHHAIMGV